MKLKFIGIGVIAATIAVGIATPAFAQQKDFKLNSFIASNNLAFSYYAKQQEQQQAMKLAQQQEQKNIEQQKINQQKQSEAKQEQATIQNSCSDSSLRLSITNDSKTTMINKINRFFEGTPMEGLGSAFVNAGIQNNIDPYFVAAITMQESSGGEFVGNSHNAWGRKALGGGWMSFDSWRDGIFNESKYLATNYLDEGLNSIHSISYKYCPEPRAQWEAGVTGFQRQIANE